MTDGTQIFHWEQVEDKGERIPWTWAVANRDGDIIATFGTYQEALICLDYQQAAAEMTEGE